MKIINSKIVNGKKMFLIEEPIKKLGGVIEDNQGQWKYPGQITKINSPNITMKGVNYPVLGISNTGHKQLMMPEQEYTFDGQSVTEYPITAQAGTTVKVNKDNVVKEYDRRSPEYKAMYDSGKLMSYDKSTDTYRATPLETFEVKTKAPQWLIDKRNIEKNFTKEKFVKKYLPKWSGSMGETADNLSENAQKDYDKKVNDKLANVLLKSNQKKGNKEANNLDWYNSFSEKEREIIQQSSLANKFAPAQRAYDLDVSNSTKKYNTTDVLTDADKLSQSVQGTPERFRLFPNAENNIESYVNPGMFLGSMAKGLGNVPKDIKNENYGQAALSIATPLGVGALAGIGNPSTGQFVNNLTNPFAGTGDLAKGIYNKGITALERNSVRNGISNQLPPPPSELYIPISETSENVINLRRDGWNGIIGGHKKKPKTSLIKQGINELLDTKFIPVKKRILPESLKPVISDLGERTQIQLVGNDNTTRASLTLREKRNWNIGDNGKIIMDEFGNPTQKPKEWMSPDMIYVNPELQGNRTQDLLYQLGIEEAKKRKLKGIYSGEQLLSPEKTKKAHERFDREVFGEKYAKPSINRETGDDVLYNESGLLGHKNPNLEQEWLENYKKLNKYKRDNISVKEASVLAKKHVINNKDNYILGTVTIPSVVGIGLASNELYKAEKKEKEQQNTINKLLKNQKQLKKEFGGKILNTKIENGKKYFLINE